VARCLTLNAHLQQRARDVAQAPSVGHNQGGIPAAEGCGARHKPAWCHAQADLLTLDRLVERACAHSIVFGVGLRCETCCLRICGSSYVTFGDRGMSDIQCLGVGLVSSTVSG